MMYRHNTMTCEVLVRINHLITHTLRNNRINTIKHSPNWDRYDKNLPQPDLQTHQINIAKFLGDTPKFLKQNSNHKLYWVGMRHVDVSRKVIGTNNNSPCLNISTSYSLTI